MKYYGDHIIDDAENRAKTRSPVTKVPKTLKPRTTHAHETRTTHAKANTNIESPEAPLTDDDIDKGKIKINIKW